MERRNMLRRGARNPIRKEEHGMHSSSESSDQVGPRVGGGGGARFEKALQST